jgi:YVTN family beta-propeller protein
MKRIKVATSLLFLAMVRGPFVDRPAEPIPAGAAGGGITAAHRAVQARAVENYGKLPLSFEPNQGQTDPRVRFVARGSGYALFLTSNEAVLSLRSQKSVVGIQKQEKRPLSVADDLKAITDQEQLTTDILRLRLVGADAGSTATPLSELPGKSSYFLGNDPKRWRTDVPTYAEVKYQNVYPGVDLVYYGNQGRLEYDFMVAPGADPSAIALAVEAVPPAGGGGGTPLLQVDATHGDLVIQTKGGKVRFHKPTVYQPAESGESSVVRRQLQGIADDGPRTTDSVNEKLKDQNPKFLKGRYVLAADNRIHFEIPNYDKSKPLVIDPVLSYSTYVGGNGEDVGLGMAVDSSGDAYLTGHTSSINFPTMNPIRSANAGGTDVFVSKLNAAGSALVYSTYLGGSSDDNGTAIAVDSSGNAYVTGQTRSTNFPTMNPIQVVNAGGADAFVAKLNAAGSALVYSTYLGGSNYDTIGGIAVDSSGNAFVSGLTASTNFPTMNPIQSANAGGYDAFVAKLNALGSALVYSTYLGGSDTENGYNIAVDSSSNAYISGITRSTNFPTVNPMQSANAGGWDTFVAKVNAAGSALVYSTYLGGSGDDLDEGFAVDSSGNAYVIGYTASTDFPTMNPIQAANAGGFDVFVAKIGTGQRTAYVSNSGSNTVSVIRTADDSVLATLAVGPNPAHIAVTPDGSKAYVVNAGGNSVSVINATNNAVAASVTVGPRPFDVAVTPDGTKAYVANAGANSVSVIDTSNNMVTATLTVQGNPVDVVIRGTKAYVLNAGSDSVSVIDTSSDRVVTTVRVGRNPFDMAVATDGTSAYVVNTGSNNVSVINTSTNLVTATVPVGYHPADVAVTPDGTKAYVTNAGSNSVSVINTSTNTVVATVSVGALPVDVVITPDGAKAYVTNSGTNSVSVINTGTNVVLTTVTVSSNPVDLAIISDGTKAYVTNAGSNSVSVINTNLNTVGTTVSVGSNPAEVVFR